MLMDRLIHRQTDSVITILHSPIKGEVKRKGSIFQFEITNSDRFPIKMNSSHFQ